MTDDPATQIAIHDTAHDDAHPTVGVKVRGDVQGDVRGDVRGDVHDEYSCAEAWAALTRAHAAVSQRLGAALHDNCGLSTNDFDALLRLRAALPGGVRVAELGEVVRLSQPAVSRMVTRLEGRGLLARCAAAEDRRGVLVALTPAGQELLARAIPVHANCLRESFLDHFSAQERAVLTTALARIDG